MFQDIACEELWIEFTTWNSTRYIPIHELASVLGLVKSRGLLMFHALTGCDTVPNLKGVGKETAYSTWKNYPEFDEVFKNLATLQKEIDRYHFNVLQRFVTMCFRKKSRGANYLAPTRGELVQHVKRSVYQAGYVWGQALLPAPRYPSPEDHGWTMDSATGGWKDTPAENPLFYRPVQVQRVFNHSSGEKFLYQSMGSVPDDDADGLLGFFVLFLAFFLIYILYDATSLLVFFVLFLAFFLIYILYDATI